MRSPAAVTTTPISAIRRGPSQSTRNPLTGARSPCSKLRRENPSEIAARLQPISSRIGWMKTPKPKIAAPASAMYQP